MAFRFKDLMITVVGEGAGPATRAHGCCMGGTICVATDCQGTGICKGTPLYGLTGPFCFVGYCDHATNCPGTGVCGGTPIGCTPTHAALWPGCCLIFTAVCTGGTNLTQLAGNAADQLGELKAQLQQAVAEIEVLEKDVKEGAHPKTVAEIEELERKLEEAMAELKKRKSELRKE